MSVAVEAFEAGYGDDLDWSFITDELVMFLTPEIGWHPSLWYRGTVVAGSQQKARGYYREQGTPWGLGGWKFDTLASIQFYYGLSGIPSVFDMSGLEGFTIACCYQPHTQGSGYRRMVYIPRVGGGYIIWDINDAGIRWNTNGALFLLCQPVGGFDLNRNYAIAGSSSNRRELRVDIAGYSPDKEHYTYASDAWGFYNFQSPSSLTVSYSIDTKQCLAGLFGPFLVTKGAWTTEQFNQWAAQPYAWAEEYEQRGLFVPATCPSGKSKIRQLVSGIASIYSTVKSKDAKVGLAVDGEVKTRPAVSTKSVKVRPAVSGEVKIGEMD